jgi:hypothetical protein
VAGHKKNKKTLRDRKNKAHPNYNFLVSYDPSQAHVNRETDSKVNTHTVKLSASKKAAELAKEDSSPRIKKDIIKSLILVSFVLLAEVVVYLARSYIRLP